MNRFGIKKGDKAICLTTTFQDGKQRKVFYVFETGASWDLYDGNGKQKPNVVRTFEPWDGESLLITDNGD